MDIRACEGERVYELNSIFQEDYCLLQEFVMSVGSFMGMRMFFIIVEDYI